MPSVPPRALAAALAVGVIAAAVAACRQATAPDGGLPGVRTAVRVLPRGAAPGEAVALVAVATNAGPDTVYAGHGCGAGLGFEVVAPDGRTVDPTAGPSICPLFDSNVLAPGETDTVTARWTAPSALGTYRVRAGVRSDRGLLARSAAADTLRVRPEPCPAAATAPAAAAAGVPLFTLVDDSLVADSAARAWLARTRAEPTTARAYAARLTGAPDTVLTLGRPVAFDVEPGRRVVLTGERAGRNAGGSLSWYGLLRGDRYASANVVATGAGVTGVLQVLAPAHAVYSLRPLGGGFQGIVCVDQSALPPDH